MDLLLDHLGKGLFYMLLISMPIVLVAAGIGLVVGILQAVTQVQEQTIAAAPKILGVFLVIMIGGTLIMRILNDYTQESLTMATEEITHTHNYSAPAKNFPDPGRARYDFFNDLKSLTKSSKPNFKEMLNSPLDSPYIKNNEPKPPTTYTPPPPLPDASISEEISNYKNMSKASKGLKMVPPMNQKAPVIPPFSTGKKVNPTISVLPTLDEPPSVNPDELKQAEKIASSQSSSQPAITGAAAYLDGSGSHKFDYKVKGSTIIINGSNNISASNSGNKNPRKGSIILEAD